MKTSSLDIKTFTDYRAFLKTYAYEAKKRNGQWTLGVWANQLQLKDTSSLTKIINGQRHPGREITKKLCTFFKFNNRDSLYFNDLVTLYKNQNNPRLCVALLEKMGKKFPNSDLAIIDTRSFEFFSLWYALPLREMVRLPWFREDYEWLASQFEFKVTSLEIKKAIELMLSLGLLKRESEKLQIAHGRVTSTFDQKNEGLKLYHEKNLDNAKISLREHDLMMREFIACCLAFNSENMPKAKELIREFKDKFEELMEENNGAQIYQLQIQFFALTKARENI
ncbi:MAG: DUF4423 domain-containing protein [Bacteriovoracaceae bacterium]